MKKFTSFLVAVAAALSIAPVLASCTGCGEEERVIPTPITDGLKLSSTLYDQAAAGKFSVDGVGYATCYTITDGDTAGFVDGTHTEDELASMSTTLKYKFRFLGVNTPESTAKVEPWGVPASAFTKSILNNAKSIILVNDIATFNQYDSSGGRNLGFIWYNMKNTQREGYRLLNLELVEQCYSKNQLFTYSDMCPYLESFVAAEETGVANGWRVHGEVDPSYDYTNTTAEVTIRDIRENFENYGIVSSSTEAASSGLQLRVKALVVALIGDNLVLRDIENGYADGHYAGIYCYAGYGSGVASWIGVGDIIYFYCRASLFNGAMQLSDLKSNSYGKQKLELLLDRSNYASDEAAAEAAKAGITYKDWKGNSHTDSFEYKVNATQLDVSEFTEYTDWKLFDGDYVECKVTVRQIEDNDNPGTMICYKTDKNNNTTVYANAYGTNLSFNVRIDGSANPRTNVTKFENGKTYIVKGYVAPYFDKYQLQLPNDDVESPDYPFVSEFSE